ncbi:MAG: hypothetical protein R3F55_10500 [Alphaproteobacteria bacterium]
MPFKAPYRPYTQGDFIFGVAESITAFQQHVTSNQGIAFKANTSQPVTTMKQLSTSRNDVANKFTGERQDLNNAYLDSLENHPKYINAPNITYDNQASMNNALFRAKSKAGLNFCVTSNRHLHFVLDDLDLAGVLAKNWKHPTKPNNPNNEFKTSATDKVRTVTGAELRWIYRNSNRPETQEYVQFWYNNAQCCPPWEANFGAVQIGAPQPQQWANYKAL